jgi:filamentous hemagglutinin family protein
VGAGQAQINPVDANRLNIVQQSDRAVINWNSFSIGAPEWVDFQQPSSTSATLNRVTGNTRSDIAGRLTANGQIMLVNPNGILFTPTAQIDVAGLAATTLDIRDQDFMNGILRFQQVPGKSLATVENQGQITVKEGGFAALVAPGVVNSGAINARLGKVVLASGTQATLDFYGDGLVSLAVDPNLAEQVIGANGQPLSALITNSGTVNADGGRVTLSAKAGAAVVDSVINMNGVIQARSVENRNGLIVLSGGDTGLVAVSGNLDASGTSPGQTGGTVQVLGKKVGLFDGTRINVSGDTGGGIALLGGDYKGQGTVPNAEYTSVGRDVAIDANAVTSGNGGKVIVWADAKTQFAGTITARGGALGGNGGFVETSGKGQLSILNGAMVNTAAPLGLKGTWLLDPTDLTVVATGGTGTISGGTNSQDDSTIDASTIVTALDGNNINLLATNSITVNAAIDASANTNPGDLTLTAPIANLNQPISLRSGSRLSGTAMTVNVGAGGIIQNGVDVATAGAIVNVAAGTFTGIGSSVVSINKDLTVRGAGADNTSVDGQNTRQVFDIAAGIVNLEGLTIQNGSVSDSGGGIRVVSGSTVNVNNSTVKGNSADFQGGGIFNEGTLAVTNSTISGNSTKNDGGGIQNRGTLMVTNSTISGNTATEDGGGIENERGTLAVINSIISGNSTTQQDGGGIENDRGTLTVTNSTISGNTAGDTGGGIENDRGTVTVTDSTISDNSAKTFGGGIDNRFDGSTLTVTNSTISGNRANDGGGISNRDTATLRNSTISNNTATDDGGGISNEGTLTVTNSSIFGNKATDDGGGVFIQGGIATLTNSTISRNSADNDGGGIASNPETPGIQGNQRLILDGVIVSENTAGEAGGGIEHERGGLLEVRNSRIERNTAKTKDGGGIENDRSTLWVINSIIERNTAGEDGGGIENTGGTIGNDPTIKGEAFIINSKIEGNTTSRFGGGIDNNQGKLTVVNSSISGNQATASDGSGGGIQNRNNGTVTVDNSLISDNTATQNGGGISNAGTLTVSNSTISRNIAKVADRDGGGGGIYNEGTARVTNSTIEQNTSNDEGGGIFNNKGTLEVSDIAISGNTATDNGGGIANEGGTVTVTRSSISNNTAIDEGGGIFNSQGKLEVTDSSISGNTVGDANTEGDGGAISNEGGTVTVTRISIFGNTATSDGGGIQNSEGGTFKVTESSIFNNTAAKDGGGIENETGTLEVFNSSIFGNKASHFGGGVYIQGGIATLTNSTIFGNTADQGGGIYNRGTTTVENSSITGNTAGTAGPDVFNTGTLITK